MAKQIELDEESAKGFDDIELAKPVRDARGNVTGYVRQSVPRGAYEAQMQLAEEDRDPRYSELKEVSAVKGQLLGEQEEKPRPINVAVAYSDNQESIALRRELAELRALITKGQKEDATSLEKSKAIVAETAQVTTKEAHGVKLPEGETDQEKKSGKK